MQCEPCFHMSHRDTPLWVRTHLSCVIKKLPRAKGQLSSGSCERVTHWNFSELTEVEHWLVFYPLSCSKGWVNPHLWTTLPRRHTSRFKLSINRAARSGSLKVITRVLRTPTGRPRSEARASSFLISHRLPDVFMHVSLQSSHQHVVTYSTLALCT